MKYVKFLSLLFIGLVCTLSSEAQMLKVCVRDNSLKAGAMMINNKDISPIKFDSKGVWTYQNDSIHTPRQITIMCGKGGLAPVVIQTGKSQTVTLSLKNGRTEVSYSGDFQVESQFYYLFMKFEPEKNERDGHNFSDMDDDELRKMAEKTKQEQITYDEAYRRLDRRYNEILKCISKVSDAESRDKFTKMANTHRLTNLLTLTEDKAWSEKRDIHKDAYYQKLLSQIDVNDTFGLDEIYRLPQTFVNYHLTTSATADNLTAYGLDYISVVNQYVKNQEVKDRLLFNMAVDLFSTSSDSPAKSFEIDTFWSAFSKVASKKIVSNLQYIVDSRKNAIAGAKCPDVTLNDIKGARHQLSDYFGTYIFIDIWATWCGPCCAEIPFIEKWVAHYKDNPKIRFISISVDASYAAWKTKLERDKPQWLQFNCDKEENKAITEQWGIVGIPRFIIINPDGTIRQADAFRPSDSEFQQKLDKIISE